MNKYKNFIITVVLCLLLCTLVACTSDGECRQSVVTSVGVEFFQPVYNDKTQDYKTQLTNLTIYVQGLDNDSVLFDNISTNSVALPLKPLEQSTEYILQIVGKTPDTLIINHTNEEHFISLECGIMVYHNLTDISFTKNQIDSVKIMHNAVKDDAASSKTPKQIRIFFKVKESV